MLTSNETAQLAQTVSAYAQNLLKAGMDPYSTLQLTLGFQSTLLNKAIETYTVPGWPTKDKNGSTEAGSGTTNGETPRNI